MPCRIGVYELNPLHARICKDPIQIMMIMMRLSLLACYLTSFYVFRSGRKSLTAHHLQQEASFTW